MVLQIILADILLVSRIFPRPCGARKNTTQLVKYPRVLSVKPSNKVYVFLSGRRVNNFITPRELNSFEGKQERKTASIRVTSQVSTNVSISASTRIHTNNENRNATFAQGRAQFIENTKTPDQIAFVFLSVCMDSCVSVNQA